MPDNEYSISDMIDPILDGSPSKFADVFSGVMVNKVNDRVDQIRQAVAAKINGDDHTTDPAMEPGPEEVDDQEQELEASDEDVEYTEESEESDSDDEKIETTDRTEHE